jgi:hypothetical protein
MDETADGIKAAAARLNAQTKATIDALLEKWSGARETREDPHPTILNGTRQRRMEYFIFRKSKNAVGFLTDARAATINLRAGARPSDNKLIVEWNV